MRKHPLAVCEKCVFKDAPFVPTQNLKPRARLAVIGEAPGAYEARGGIPFTGPSGRLLDQVLQHHGYSREDVMVTNVCLCRPTNNDDPPKSAIECCQPRLVNELAESGVEKILAVGGTAASTLINPKLKISKLRVGAPKPYINDPKIEVVATWHPAYCLRSPDSFPTFVSDMAKLRGDLYTKKWIAPDYRVFDNETALLALERLSSLRVAPIVIDIETGEDKDDTFEHPDQHNLLCIGLAYAKQKVVVFGENALKLPSVQEALGAYLQSRPLIAHNGKSDLAGLRPIFGKLKLFADTMLMSYTLDERPGFHALGKLGIEVLGTHDWKADFKKLIPPRGNYASPPRKDLYKYNSIDCGVTWDLWEFFSSRMSERENRVHEFLIKASNVVVNLEMAGIGFDMNYSLELQEVLEKELDQLEIEISDTTGWNLNPRSPMQITKWFAEQGMFLSTTNADTLEAIRENTNNEKIKTFIGQLLLHRRGAKLNGTYVKGFQRRIHNGKVFTTYTLHGTTSGRLASKNPNLQNIVRDKRIKHQFTVEEEENVLIQADYKQAEGRAITTLAKDEYLASIFNDETRDIFNELCDQIYTSGNWGKEERVKIKSVFYGLSYGRGAESIAHELDISVVEARELLANFKALIPATVSWQASVTNMVLNGEDLITPFGRKRSFWLITDQNKKDVLNEALSFLPQSIASDICLSALISIQPKIESIATTRLTIHDALIFECHEKYAEEVIAIAKEEMANAGRAFTDFVPFVVDVSMGKRWSEL